MKTVLEFDREELQVVNLALKVIARKTRYRKSNVPKVAARLSDHISNLDRTGNFCSSHSFKPDFNPESE